MYPLDREKGELQFGKSSATELIEQFGSPLYLYDEETMRARCREMKNLCSLPNFRVYYSAKANTSIALLKIARQEGLHVDAMTVGEIYQEKLAGFTKEEILFLSNNVQPQHFQEVIDQDILVCIDSLSQLETYCALAPGKEVYIRVNPGKGAGHHEKVITAGKVKFGIEPDGIPEAFEIAKKHSCRLTGFQMHIGSLFLQGEEFTPAIQTMLDIAKQYPQIEYIDFGGGFGIPYDREQEQPFPLEKFSETFTSLLTNWMEETGRKPIFAIEPGRFLVAEAGSCLIQVQATKVNSGIKFIGTDLGFNFLLRPEFYGSYHEIIHATNGDNSQKEVVTVVGNVCESGDHLGKDRELPLIQEQDLLLIRDTGAYGFSMASNYNSMMRPAEVLIQSDGKARLIRKRETIETLVNNQIF
ncbi:MAG: diaminopimelate decarboxylase [SAR324 cluster bacterium]|uniref:Diaminopimelate decarboxylase n=1 Tax=SAR324 cluster bacterium TaxID=2024889 RepID=A0A2A4T9S4_9DELT|nr:MAG: diaminopimelate decarboxylase [SAR324 cluster bacterium]